MCSILKTSNESRRFRRRLFAGFPGEASHPSRGLAARVAEAARLLRERRRMVGSTTEAFG